jgi:hypothetical protein
MASLHNQYRGYTIEQIVEALEGDASPGSPHHVYLENLLSARTAEMVNKQLAQTASSIGASANLLNNTLENSSEWLVNAIKVSTEAATKNAEQIGEQITSLSAALTKASDELKSAGAQSTSLGRRLNWLTGILTLAALISAGATAFSAWETKRQVDLMEQQLRQMRRPPQGSTTPVPQVQH